MNVTVLSDLSSSGCGLGNKWIIYLFYYMYTGRFLRCAISNNEFPSHSEDAEYRRPPEAVIVNTENGSGSLSLRGRESSEAY